jgi:hypothetical protein
LPRGPQRREATAERDRQRGPRVAWPLELLGGALDAIRREDGGPSSPDATEAEMRELQAIFSG